MQPRSSSDPIWRKSTRNLDGWIPAFAGSTVGGTQPDRPRLKWTSKRFKVSSTNRSARTSSESQPSITGQLGPVVPPGLPEAGAQLITGSTSDHFHGTKP